MFICVHPWFHSSLFPHAAALSTGRDSLRNIERAPMLASWRKRIARCAAARDGRPSNTFAEEEKLTRGSWEKPIEGTDTRKRVWAVPCDCTGKDRDRASAWPRAHSDPLRTLRFRQFRHETLRRRKRPRIPKWNHAPRAGQAGHRSVCARLSGRLGHGPAADGPMRRGQDASRRCRACDKSFCAGTRDFFTITANCSRKFREATIPKARPANSACSNPC